MFDKSIEALLYSPNRDIKHNDQSKKLRIINKCYVINCILFWFLKQMNWEVLELTLVSRMLYFCYKC